VHIIKCSLLDTLTRHYGCVQIAFRKIKLVEWNWRFHPTEKLYGFTLKTIHVWNSMKQNKNLSNIIC